MNTTSFDVLVAGGGPVGWACALAARHALGNTARVAVVERDALPDAKSWTTDKPLSARVYTVAAGNLRWLASQDVVLDPARSATVSEMRVHGRNGAESLHIRATDIGEDELARIIEHEAMTFAIARAAVQAGVLLVCGEGVDVHDGGDVGVEAKLLELADRSLLQARLVIVADGVQSRLRDAAGLVATRHSYPQHGVVANLIAESGHRDTAAQWFLPDGSILALLPLPDIAGASAMSMVWSADPRRAASLCAMADDELLRAINAISGQTIRLRAVAGRPRSFPLNLLRLADPVGKRVLVVGDAAHAMHPLAGQGVNVGLADARCLFDLWSSVAMAADDPGHPLLLARYRRQRYGPTLAMQMTTDGLFRLYNQSEQPLLMAAGDAGMRLLGRVPAFRRTLSTAAMQ
ncbi:FAD-dependent monooxygenase [Casimicrobium huifangae]|uniref:FAD-dependent monooxygenase n=1 Tax=Casimicrobium huifangae TaxID=2591109 RepID=UPI0037845AF9